jgi:hypothetical protein
VFTLFGAEALEYRLANSGARALITDRENLTKMVPTSKPPPEATLVKALARAWRRQQMLDEGVRTSVTEIGDAENISKRYIRRSCVSRCWHRISSKRSSLAAQVCLLSSIGTMRRRSLSLTRSTQASPASQRRSWTTLRTRSPGRLRSAAARRSSMAAKRSWPSAVPSSHSPSKSSQAQTSDGALFSGNCPR